MASWWNEHVYPRVLDTVCGTRAVDDERARWIPHAHGAVLEIGIGSGLNLPLLDPARVTSVVGVEPSAPLRARCVARARGVRVAVDVVAGVAEALPLDAACFDTVLLAYTLCSVADPTRTIAEARRVLRPGGQLIFLEHGVAPDAATARWQRRLTPAWRAVAGNCHLDRDIVDLIRGAFAITEVDARVASRLSYATSGVAVAPTLALA